jgi:NAD(P)H dehydrogenase (quinone)
MRIFIVHAHHEPTSFNGAMTARACEVLRAANHEVIVSDLHAMRFDPVSDRRNFVTVGDPSRLKKQTEEEYASANDGFAPDLRAEMDKLFSCDVLIFQFPLWWVGLPAILKGWIDRVFAMGRAYGGGRYFSRGVFTGKRAMCSITVAGSEAAYSDAGAYGPMEAILFPIHHGILGFVGFTVIEPFVVYAPARMTAEDRRTHLARYDQRLLTLCKAPTLGTLNIAGYEGLIRKTQIERT